MSEKDRIATREFAIRSILIQHFSFVISPNVIEKVVKALSKGMISGPCAWAFNVALPPIKGGYNPPPLEARRPERPTPAPPNKFK